MKKLLAVLLVALLVLSLSACATAGQTTDYTGMEPEAAATQAIETTKDSLGMSDIIRVPFGYLLDVLYQFVNNYGLALIIFSLIVKIVLFPMSIKSKRSMLKTSRLAPEVKALERKYGDDKQAYQVAVNELYKEEGVSMTGGCVWSIIPLMILLPLYYVIREPITYMMHNTRSISAGVVAYLQASGVEFGTRTFYAQLTAASKLQQYAAELKALPIFEALKVQNIDFGFLGVNLAEIPGYRFWTYKSWPELGLFLIPVVSAAIQVVSMLISQKMNNAVATNANGEVDKSATQAQNQTTQSMMLMMPLMSLWIGYSMPAAISIYWIAQGLFGLVQEVYLNKICRKEYEEEDAARRERAAKRAAEEAEKERLRAERKAANPDGIIDNTSKKKLKAREKEQARLNATPEGKMTEEELAAYRAQKALSGDPDRPWCRGRNYVADRYSNGEEIAEPEAEETAAEEAADAE